MWQKLFVFFVIIPSVALVGMWAYLRTWGGSKIGRVAREKRAIEERRRVRQAIESLYQGQTIVVRDAEGRESEAFVVTTDPRHDVLTIVGEDGERTVAFSDVVEIL